MINNIEERGCIMEFKEKVLLVRAKLNLSQKKLGELLNLSLATINRWENGRVQPSKKDLVVFEEFCKENNIYFNEVDSR